MTFKVWKGKIERDVYLMLMEDKEGLILKAVDKQGDVLIGGYILRLNKEGDLTLYTTVSKDLGLQLDAHGRIKLAKD